MAPASSAQRAKVAGQRCAVCGAATRIDPAHLVPRALGGCEEADCVVALCRTHHRAYDQAGLDLIAFLEPDWRREVAHAVLHLGLAGALRRLGGRRTTGDER
jgi:predicted restriction endonuclease